MNRTDEILEKYFAGISTLQEEEELKLYFNGNSIAPAHRCYAPLFQAFSNEKRVKFPTLEISKVNATTTAKRISLRRKLIYFSTSVAAACLFILMVFRYQTTSNSGYMIVHGKRINNSEMAKDFANAKIEKSMNVIHKSLDSYKENKEVQRRLQEIENQLNVK